VGFVVDMLPRWGRFFASTSVSPANLLSINFFTITITYQSGLVQ
jgi:hypothetical protein